MTWRNTSFPSLEKLVFFFAPRTFLQLLCSKSLFCLRTGSNRSMDSAGCLPAQFALCSFAAIPSPSRDITDSGECQCEYEPQGQRTCKLLYALLTSCQPFLALSQFSLPRFSFLVFSFLMKSTDKTFCLCSSFFILSYFFVLPCTTHT